MSIIKGLLVGSTISIFYSMQISNGVYFTPLIVLVTCQYFYDRREVLW
jgi:hypothetical protein